MADIAIITGATGGIGLEFVKAIHLLDEIDEIWAVGRNNEKLNYLKEEYEKVIPIKADFSMDGVSVLAERIEENNPNIRILINNAGIAHMGAFEKMQKEDIVFQVLFQDYSHKVGYETMGLDDKEVYVAIVQK